MKTRYEVNCTYSGWVPLGRSRKRCPSCGAELYAGGTHEVALRRVPDAEPAPAKAEKTPKGVSS